MEVHVDGWAFIPTLYNGAVETFVALRLDPPEGENLTSMWFIRGADNSWSSWNWSEQDQTKTVGYVKVALQIPSSDDRNWRVMPATVNPEDFPPGMMVRGVFVDDPFADTVASSTDPDELLDFLVTIGWSAARTSIISSECPVSTSLEALAYDVQQELANPGQHDFAAIHSLATTCQGGGTPPPPPPPPPITCNPVTVIGGVSASGCVFLGWTFNGTTTVPATGGGCWIQNSWTGSHFYYERRNVRKIYANCTTCTMTQTRYKDCTAGFAGVDFGIGVVNPCAIPAGYTPPAGPAAGTSCGATNETCGNWSDWGPPIDSVCP